MWEVGWWGGRILPAGNTALLILFGFLVVPCGLQDLDSPPGIELMPWQCKGGVQYRTARDFPCTGLAVLISAGDWRQPRLASSGAELRPARKVAGEGLGPGQEPHQEHAVGRVTPLSLGFLGSAPSIGGPWSSDVDTVLTSGSLPACELWSRAPHCAVSPAFGGARRLGPGN